MTGNKYIDLMVAKALQLQEAGHHLEAINALTDLLKLDPDNASLHYHVAAISLELRDNLAANNHLRELVRLQPDFLDGWMLLGIVCAELGLHEEAVASLRRVLKQRPGVAEIHHRIGLCLTDLKKYDEALQAYEQALRIEPENAGVLCSLGILFTSTGQITEARGFLLRALGKDPNAINVINNLGRISKFLHATESLQWFQRGLDLDSTSQTLTSNYLYTLNYVPGLSPEFIAAKYREYAPRAFPRTEKRPAANSGRGNGRIRIGYLSGDMYAHSVAFFLEPIMECHDRERFEIFCYSNRTASDETTERLKRQATEWRIVYGLPDDTVADLISKDSIDILVELSGHTSGNRLGVCVLRPARVNASWLGHPNTTGLPQMDYYLTDAWCDPCGVTDHLYSERLYRLPHVFCTYRPLGTSPDVGPVPSACSDSITFGCFNSVTKFNEEIVSLWVEILKQLPHSRMVIKGPNVTDEGIRRDLLESFGTRGIEPQRIVIRGVTHTREEHLELYSHLDIALDTYPYHGTTTTCEALWMGVPVVSLAGRTHVSRVGVSLLNAVGLPDLIAESPAKYVAKAVQLAKDHERLHTLRHNLRQMMSDSPLMDWHGVTRDVEQAYVDMLNHEA